MTGGDSDVVLGIDTATAFVAVGAVRAGEAIAETEIPPETGGRPRHGTELLGAVEEAVRASGGWPEICLLGVGVGPGTFTGLRIGIATARALAQARTLPLAPVGSLEALARGIEGDPVRPRLALIDARRGEVFAGLFESGGEAIQEPFVAAPSALVERLSGLGRTPLAAGDGSLRFREQLEDAGVEVLPDESPAHRMAARNICALAGRVPRVKPEQLKPIYLRKPDAEVWRQQQA